MYNNIIIFNSTGLPAVSIPYDLTKNNLPVGVRLIGSPLDEASILAVAYNYEFANCSLEKFKLPL